MLSVSLSLSLLSLYILCLSHLHYCTKMFVIVLFWWPTGDGRAVLYTQYRGEEPFWVHSDHEGLQEVQIRP